jgi:hypothetical protein
MAMQKMLLLTLPLVLAGCETWGPTWSELTGARWYRTEMNRRPAIIERIDNEGPLLTSPMKIEPGRHVLEVRGPDPTRPGGGTRQAFTLVAEPCKRYYINAQYESPVSVDWKPVIDYVEDIAGCKVAAK